MVHQDGILIDKKDDAEMTKEEGPEMPNNDDALTIEDIIEAPEETVQEQIERYIAEDPNHTISEYFKTHLKQQNHDLMKALLIIWIFIPERYSKAFDDYVTAVCNRPTKTTTLWWGTPSFKIQSRSQVPKLQEQYWKASIIIPIFGLIISLIFNILQFLYF